MTRSEGEVDTVREKGEEKSKGGRGEGKGMKGEGKG